MRRVLLPLTIALLVLGCKKAETASSTTVATSETVVAPLPTTVPTQTSAAPVSTPATAAPVPAGVTLASQETNWKGVVADITEFRRKGNSLTAKVRLTNRGSEPEDADIMWAEVSLVDTAGGKKYQVLKDEKDVYLAYLKQGWGYRWYDKLKPGESVNLWMKFPAPPPEVKAITLQMPGMAPFEDVPIQD